jgi:hypothetical protein
LALRTVRTMRRWTTWRSPDIFPACAGRRRARAAGVGALGAGGRACGPQGSGAQTQRRRVHARRATRWGWRPRRPTSKEADAAPAGVPGSVAAAPRPCDAGLNLRRCGSGGCRTCLGNASPSRPYGTRARRPRARADGSLMHVLDTRVDDAAIWSHSRPAEEHTFMRASRSHYHHLQ